MFKPHYQHIAEKIAALALAAILIIALIPGCSSANGTASSQSSTTTQTASASPSWPQTITDMAGRQVTLNGPATRVVALAPGDVEILAAIGAQSTLVGRGEYCDYPTSIEGLPELGTGSDTSVEQIIALNPDLVVMNIMDQTTNQAQQLEDAGIPVLASESTTIDGVYADITMLGQATGYVDGATELASNMKASFSQLQAQSQGASFAGKSIYFEVSPLAYGLYTAGSGTFMDEIATMLGLRNIFSDVSGWAQVSAEQVIARDPDYIVTITVPVAGEQSPTDEIEQRSGWSDITAVADGHVWCIDPDALSRPGPRLVDGARALYEQLSA
jgi:iron complex transport system substrate-binding protein